MVAWEEEEEEGEEGALNQEEVNKVVDREGALHLAAMDKGHLREEALQQAWDQGVVLQHSMKLHVSTIGSVGKLAGCLKLNAKWTP